MGQAHGWRAAVMTATGAPQLPISALRMRRRTAREGEGQPRRTECTPLAHSLPLQVSAIRTPFPVHSPGWGAGPCTVYKWEHGSAHPFACATARIRPQGGQVTFFGAGRGRVVSPPRGVVLDVPLVPSVGGAVGTAARRPALAGQLVIVIGELRGGVAALAALPPRVVKCASSRADRLGKCIREPSERSRVQRECSAVHQEKWANCCSEHAAGRSYYHMHPYHKPI